MKAEELGGRLRVARERAGMTQTELSLAVGHDQRSISQRERGIRKIPAVDIPKFATVLNVPIMFFYVDQLEPADLDDELLRVFHQLPTLAAQQTFIQWIHDLLDLLQDH